LLIFDPIFYLVSIPAVLLYGVAKGGFAGPLAILGVSPIIAKYMLNIIKRKKGEEI